MRGARGTLVLLAVVATLLGGCRAGGDEGERVGSGDVVSTHGDIHGRPVFVETPVGRLDVVVSDPVEKTTDVAGQDLRAPEKGSLVGVQWTWDSLTGFAAMAPDQADPVVPRVRLVADGHEYDLGTAVLRDPRAPDEPVLNYRGTAWVAVRGTPDELAVAVDYDGLDQRAEVGEMGDDVSRLLTPAGVLYRQPDELARHTIDCGHPVAAGRGPLRDRSGQCRLDVARVPYERTAGWVTDVQDRWLVVDARVWPESYLVDRSTSCGEGVLGTVRYRLDGAKPVGEVDGDRSSFGPVDRVVFRTAAVGQHRLVMTAVQTFPTDPVECPPLRLSWQATV